MEIKINYNCVSWINVQLIIDSGKLFMYTKNNVIEHNNRQDLPSNF